MKSWIRGAAFVLIAALMLVVPGTDIVSETHTARGAVTVQNSVMSEAGIKLNYTDVVIQKGSIVKLKLKNAKGKSVTWTTSNKKAVSVTQKGVVTALKAGKTVKITAICDGVKYVCKVKTVKSLTEGKDTSKEPSKTSEETEQSETKSTAASEESVQEKWVSKLTYEANNKAELYEALKDGFEKRANEVLVKVPAGKEAKFCSSYSESGERNDYFQQLLHDDRVLSGYANNFSMSYGSSIGGVLFIPEYKAAWDAVTMNRMTGFKSDMGKKVLKEVKNLVEKATKGLTTDVEKLEAVYDAIAARTTYRYSNTPGPREYSQYDAPSLLFDGSCVCEAYASVLQLACEIMGIDSILVSGKSMGENHAWNKIYVEGKWYNFDLTFDDHDRTYGAERNYFMINDELLSLDHNWNTKYYPTCD